MYGSLPSFVLGFHGCDKDVALKILNGKQTLNPSTNSWDWLGEGMYFWEHDAFMALSYAQDVATDAQFAKGKIKTPFVIGAIIDLKSCWNLPTSGGVKLLKKGYKGLKKTTQLAGLEMPKNKNYAARFLDRAVIEYIHGINEENNFNKFDTVRGAFEEGDPVYDGTTITQKNHIQICVRNPKCIRGYFLPQPIEKYNPHL
ncbi:hypothetical protein N7E81_07585 [Reichenbachiella carrageenanivorans]|uniref:Uncharacterized protein n=1 Tax=Reichenbachiella carrageenanivorans TaxID=2979869 RepID=A0ABY6D749_9BACT|nr:hypothetical protein [Reichenbachiella carrageenanivorans]UXX80958.1 hypothetical protein N7E81_07585 [Reichenbachiella carrageenanivorans]